MKKDKKEQITEEEEMHPWLLKYKKDHGPSHKLDTLKEAVISIENNLGVVSIVTIINTIFIVVLAFGALITGVIGVSGAISDQLIGMVKSSLHK